MTFLSPRIWQKTKAKHIKTCLNVANTRLELLRCELDDCKEGSFFWDSDDLNELEKPTRAAGIFDTRSDSIPPTNQCSTSTTNRP